jgi:hypothetical protein
MVIAQWKRLLMFLKNGEILNEIPYNKPFQSTSKAICCSNAMPTPGSYESTQRKQAALL